MEEQKNTHPSKFTISVGGNVGGNVQIDDHSTKSNASVSHVTAGGDATLATGGATVSAGSAKNTPDLSKDEALQLFQKMIAEVDQLEVDDDRKRSAKEHLKQAVSEVEQEKKPDKRTVAEFLKKATEILKEGGVTAAQAVAFGQLVGIAAA